MDAETARLIADRERDLARDTANAENEADLPATPLLDDDEDWLSPGLEAALTEVFQRVDADGDGVWSRAEVQAWARLTNKGVEFTQFELDDMRNNLAHNARGGFLLDGLFQLYHLQTQGHAGETWNDLHAWGYDDALALVDKNMPPPPSSSSSSSSAAAASAAAAASSSGTASATTTDESTVLGGWLEVLVALGADFAGESPARLRQRLIDAGHTGISEKRLKKVKALYLHQLTTTPTLSSTAGVAATAAADGAEADDAA
jgi:hypothetical protein